eukprot:TRINITY_DN101377_c0_g1_i1.p2 TRINITY_DN101377_c0_g1~~TRINITY_DN101377_c0_g1_i1.p2  ORF type:complete len:101 (-),score=23.60 TRINITY_DN101377_c0_g1_i1:115-417(-)
MAETHYKGTYSTACEAVDVWLTLTGVDFKWGEFYLELPDGCCYHKSVRKAGKLQRQEGKISLEPEVPGGEWKVTANGFEGCVNGHAVVLEETKQGPPPQA